MVGGRAGVVQYIFTSTAGVTERVAWVSTKDGPGTGNIRSNLAVRCSRRKRKWCVWNQDLPGPPNCAPRWDPVVMMWALREEGGCHSSILTGKHWFCSGLETPGYLVLPDQETVRKEVAAAGISLSPLCRTLGGPIGEFY